jgi:hypothetical protein
LLNPKKYFSLGGSKNELSEWQRGIAGVFARSNPKIY